MNIDFKKNISEALILSSQKTLFKSDTEDILASACVEYLKNNGYRVLSPIKYRYEIRDIDSLIDLFYDYLDSKDIEHVKVYRHLGRDRITAKRFVENRMVATGAKKSIALRECAEIITTVLDNQDKFKFKYGLTFSIFSQAKLGWVTDVAIRMLNKKIDRESIDNANKIREEMLASQNMSDLEEDLDSILAGIEEVNV